MKNKQVNIALLSPNESRYSETFIKAHRELLAGNIHYYHGGYPPGLADHGHLANWGERVLIGLANRLKLPLIDGEQLILQKLKQSFIIKKIEVVLAEYGPTGVSCLEVCKNLQLPLIVHFHGFDAYSHKTLEKYRTAYQQVFNYAKFIVAVSKPMKEQLKSLGCPEEKIIVSACGPSELFFEVNNQPTEKLIVAVGRFTPKKAPDLTIRAFSKVHQQYPDAKLIMVGGHREDPVLYQKCQQLVKTLHLSKAIHFPDVLSPAKIADLFAKANMFVQHSLTPISGDSEGTPVIILEASAAGVPVVSTLHAGIPDIITHRQTGLLVPEHDVDGMANAMIELLKHPDLAKAMGVAGRKRISNYFTLHHHITQINEIVSKSLTC